MLVSLSNLLLYQTSLGLTQELGEAESSKCITMTRAPESGLQSQQPTSQEDMFTFCSVQKSKVSSVHYKRNIREIYQEFSNQILNINYKKELKLELI